MNAALRFTWFTMLIILSQLVVACGGDDSLSQVPARDVFGQPGKVFAAPQPSTYPIDPLFAEFYNFLGGEELLGPAISTVTGTASQKQQYVQAGLLVYDSLAPESERFSLAPLGRGVTSFDVDQGGALPNSKQPASNPPIHPDFRKLYEALGGARIIGQALGEARYNPERSRWEQYFENLGFYRLEQDERVKLMAYGASACDFRCRFRPPADSLPNRLGVLPEPFSGRAKALGQGLTGSPLTAPRMAQDGKQEVVFENVVLVVDRASPDGVAARPLPEVVGIQPQAMSPRQPDPLLVFYPLKGDLGHNVPAYFNEFLEQHGGLGVSGLPTSEVILVEPGLYRQCFANLCLDFNLNAPDGKQLSPTPLGSLYLERTVEQQVNFAHSQSVADVDLQIWESWTFVSSDEVQEVHVAVFEDGQPLKNREPVLNLTLPDGSPKRYHFPPTGIDGLSSLTLPEIAASSGTLIAYQVCLNGLSGKQACVGDNFMIWNHP